VGRKEIGGEYIDVPWATMDTVADISCDLNDTAYRRALKGRATGRPFFLGKTWDIRKMSEASPLSEQSVAMGTGWDRSDAGRFVRVILPILDQTGFEARVVGGVVSTGWSEHDLDLLLHPTQGRDWADNPPDVSGLIQFAKDQGWVVKDREADQAGELGPDDPSIEITMPDGKEVDLFFTEDVNSHMRVVRESVIDPTRSSLDPDVFREDGSGRPKLRSGVRGYLLGIAGPFQQYGRVNGVYIVGSLLSYQWLRKSDLDLHIALDASEERIQAAFDDPRRKVGMLPGTDHEIQIYIEPKEIAFSHYDGVYDLIHDQWIKGPYNESVDAEAFLTIYRDFIRDLDVSIGELKRDIIDYEVLRQLDAQDLQRLEKKTSEKVKEINRELHWLSGARSIIRLLRSRAFRLDKMPEHLADLKSKQQVPENVLYKLLERYAYMRLLNAVDKTLDSGGISDPEQYQNLKTVLFGEEAEVDEMTTAAAAGSYDVPLGATPQGRRNPPAKKRKKKRKKDEDE
jgi:hypothetical protein